MKPTILTIAFCLSGLCVLAITTAAQNAGARPQPAAANGAASARERLTNAAIIELTQFGFGDAVIIEKIRQSDCQFDTGLNALKQLKAARVTDAVIAAMINPAPPAGGLSFTVNPPSSIPTTASPKPVAPVTTSATLTNVLDSRGRAVALPPDKGAYLWDGDKHILLTQNQVSQMGANVSSFVKGALVPFAKHKFEMQLIGKNANLQFDDPQPVILLSGLGDVIPGVPAYRLLYVKQGGMRKDRRILGTYDIGGFGSVAMVDNEIPCEIKKVAEGIYALKPQRPLPDGEYGLVPVTRAADMQSNSKSMGMPPVWDFGIYAEGKVNAK